VDGDDAAELMEAFAGEFDVDLAGFDFSQYFGSEGFNPFYDIFVPLFRRDKLKHTEITLQDLASSTEAKSRVAPTG